MREAFALFALQGYDMRLFSPYVAKLCQTRLTEFAGEATTTTVVQAVFMTYLVTCKIVRYEELGDLTQ